MYVVSLEIVTTGRLVADQASIGDVIAARRNNPINSLLLPAAIAMSSLLAAIIRNPDGKGVVNRIRCRSPFGP
jgi:hypothetical protein